MPSPSSSLATLRNDLGGSLEEFSLQADRQGFIGLSVMPVFEAALQAGSFGIIPVEQLLQNADDARAPGSGYNRGNFKFEASSYACTEHGHEEPVDDRQAQMYRDYFDAEMIAAERARDVVLRNMEKRIAALLFPGAYTPTPVTNEWDDYTNATPIVDVEASVQRVYDACGLWPNALIISRKVFRNLRNCAQIVDRMKSQGFVDVRSESITTQVLGEVFDLPRIIVAGGTKNTANEGQSASFDQIWSGEYAMVARIAMTNDIQEPCIGRVLHWSADGSQIGATMESYRDETIRGDVIRARMDVQEKLFYSVAADLLSNITT